MSIELSPEKLLEKRRAHAAKMREFRAARAKAKATGAIDTKTRAQAIVALTRVLRDRKARPLDTIKAAELLLRFSEPAEDAAPNSETIAAISRLRSI